jgi:hypothetical protein
MTPYASANTAFVVLIDYMQTVFENQDFLALDIFPSSGILGNAQFFRVPEVKSSVILSIIPSHQNSLDSS